MWSTRFQLLLPGFISLLLLFSVSSLEPSGKVNWQKVSSLLSEAVSDCHSGVNHANHQMGLPFFSLGLHRLVPREHPAKT